MVMVMVVMVVVMVVVVVSGRVVRAREACPGAG